MLDLYSPNAYDSTYLRLMRQRSAGPGGSVAAQTGQDGLPSSQQLKETKSTKWMVFLDLFK